MSADMGEPTIDKLKCSGVFHASGSLLMSACPEAHDPGSMGGLIHGCCWKTCFFVSHVCLLWFSG